jgi:hypothetical protein
MRLSLVFLFVLLAATACTRHAMEPKEVVLTVYVAPTQVDCVGMMPQKCLLVRLDPADPWIYHYDGIENFTYEPGFHYELLVRQRTLRNPPQDSSSREWRLIAVVSKVPTMDG